MKANRLLFVIYILLFSACEVIAKGSAPTAPPTYYSINDLRSQLKSEYFYFADAYKPAAALVDLYAIPLYAASANKRQALAYMIRANPSKYRVDASDIGSNSWNDQNNIAFDWVGFKNQGGQKGDLIFLRASGPSPDIVKIFSGWAHIAMVDDVSKNDVFESTSVSGVNVNYAPTSWGNVSYYTCKRVQGLSASQISSIIDAGKSKYCGLPYIPTVSTTQALLTFVYKWANKNDTNSMYCSKLVYNTFKDYVNLDSNETSLTADNDGSRLWDPAVPGLSSFIGVSPDDIYYSNSLGWDFCPSPNLYSDGLVAASVKK